jgi:hypothetical protein
VRRAVRRVFADDALRHRSGFLRDQMNSLPDPVDVIWETLAELAGVGSSRGTRQ